MKRIFFFLFILYSVNVYGNVSNDLNLSFINNMGQIKSSAIYYIPYSKGAIYLNKHGEIIYSIVRNKKLFVIKESFGCRDVNLKAKNKVDREINYFIGNQKDWTKRVHAFEDIEIDRVFKGVKLILKSNNRGVEKFFTVYPYVDVSKIKIKLSGVKDLKLDDEGNLLIDNGVMKFEKPYAYQYINGKKIFVDISYKTFGNEYGFEIKSYDRSKELIIDPLLGATYLGGGLIDSANDVVIDNDTGNIYVVGSTFSSNFPVTPGVYDISYNSNQDVFILCINRSLTSIKFATFFGGSGIDTGRSIEIDNLQNIIITGDTTSNNFPTTNGAFNRFYGGSDLPDAFVTKFNKTLNTLLASTYLGGSNGDISKALAVDNVGNIYVAGVTNSNDFPVTLSSHDPTYNGGLDIFVTKLNNTLTNVLLSTYLGGTGDEGVNGVALAINVLGDIYISGDTNSINFPTTATSYNTDISGAFDGFITKLDKNDFTIQYSTYLGGIDDDIIKTIFINPSNNNVIVGGLTSSTDFPTTISAIDRKLNGTFDGFISIFNENLDTLFYSTFLGGSRNDAVEKIFIDRDGNIIAGGETTSDDFPINVNSFDSTFNGVQDVFLVKINPLLTSIISSTYYGGSGAESINGMIISDDGYLYIVGLTTSTNLPTLQINVDRVFSGTQDGYIAKFDGNFTNFTGSINVTPLSFDFGSTIIKTTSISQIFTVKNNGVGELEIGLCKITGSSLGSFKILTDNCSNKTLVPSQECSITISFTPLSTGTKTAVLLIPSSDPTVPNAQISLTGIGLPAVVVTSPNGGEVLTSGGSYNITWNASPGVSFVDIQFSTNGGFTWSYIAKNITNTNYLWTVPALSKNSKSLIKVIGKDLSGKVLGSDKSDRAFIIEVIKITTPNGGEIYTSGEIPLGGIAWNTNATINAVSQVKVFISYNNGFTWKLITNISGDPGFYNWTVPIVTKTIRTCRIKVILLDSLGKNIGFDISDSAFTINPL